MREEEGFSELQLSLRRSRDLAGQSAGSGSSGPAGHQGPPETEENAEDEFADFADLPDFRKASPSSSPCGQPGHFYRERPHRQGANMFQQKGSLKGSAKGTQKGKGHPTHYFGLGLYTMEVVDDGASFFANDQPDRGNRNVTILPVDPLDSGRFGEDRATCERSPSGQQPRPCTGHLRERGLGRVQRERPL